MKNANKSGKILYFTMVRKVKKCSGIRIQNRISTKSQSLLEGHPLPVPAMFGRRLLPRSLSYVIVSYPAHRTTDRQNDRPHYSTSLSGVQ